jgi:hypothetical protein
VSIPSNPVDTTQQSPVPDSLLIEKTMLGLYPRLHLSRPQGLMNALVASIAPNSRRLVHLYCGDGLFSNWLSFHCPELEIIGIDPDTKNIATANATIGQRRNLRFIQGQPGIMDEIPCDRILYSRPLSRIGNIMAFKKMLLKTSSWLVSEGDWIIEETLAACLLSIPLLKSSLSNHRSPFTLLREALKQVDYGEAHLLNQDSFFGLQSQIALYSHIKQRPTLQELVQAGKKDMQSQAGKLIPSAGGLDDIFRLSQQASHQWELG